MDANLSLSLLLMVVGMTTVFITLFSVVIIGNLIIRVVNKYFPEEVKKAVSTAITSSTIEKNKMAAIIAAIDIVTAGKGKIIQVEKK